MGPRSTQDRTQRTPVLDAQNVASALAVAERPVSAVRAPDVSEWLRMQGGKAHVGMRRLGKAGHTTRCVDWCPLASYAPRLGRAGRCSN